VLGFTITPITTNVIRCPFLIARLPAGNSCRLPVGEPSASGGVEEQMISAFTQRYDLAATSLRYFNVADATGNHGERHPIETHLIPLALQVAIGERDELAIFGTDYPNRDGTAVRDYIHLQDLVRAHLLHSDTQRRDGTLCTTSGTETATRCSR